MQNVSVHAIIEISVAIFIMSEEKNNIIAVQLLDMLLQALGRLVSVCMCVFGYVWEYASVSLNVPLCIHVFRVVYGTGLLTPFLTMAPH